MPLPPCLVDDRSSLATAIEARWTHSPVGGSRGEEEKGKEERRYRWVGQPCQPNEEEEKKKRRKEVGPLLAQGTEPAQDLEPKPS